MPGDTLTIYSSLPLQGPHKAQSQSIVNGEKLALKEAGGKAGEFKVNFASRDDATAGDSDAPGWNPGRTADNASKAAQDSRTIAYIGEFDSGRFGDLDSDHQRGQLRAGEPRGDGGRPDEARRPGPRRGSPTGSTRPASAPSRASFRRTTCRPRRRCAGRRRSARAGSSSWTTRASRAVALVEQFRIAAEGGSDRHRPQGDGPARRRVRATWPRRSRATRPDLVYFGGGVESNALRFWRDMHAAAPSARLMGSDRLLVPDFYGRLGGAAARTYLTSATQRPQPAAAARDSASCATIAASSASSPTPTPPTVTRRCRCCST